MITGLTTILLIGGVFVVIGATVMYSIGKSSTSSNEPVTFEAFKNDMSNMTDKYMVSQGKKDGIKYYGGSCIISIENQDMVKVDIKIFGKNAKDEWIESSIVHRRKRSLFSNDFETQNKLSEIKVKPLEFKVTSPK